MIIGCFVIETFTLQRLNIHIYGGTVPDLHTFVHTNRMTYDGLMINLIPTTSHWQYSWMNVFELCPQIDVIFISCFFSNPPSLKVYRWYTIQGWARRNFDWLLDEKWLFYTKEHVHELLSYGFSNIEPNHLQTLICLSKFCHNWRCCWFYLNFTYKIQQGYNIA